MYTPKTTAEYEAAIAKAWSEKYPDWVPLAEPLEMRLIVSPKGIWVRIQDGATPSKMRGDVDNYSKAIMDGLNEVAYTDDKWITSLTATKT